MVSLWDGWRWYFQGCWYLHDLSTFRQLPTGKMPSLQQAGQEGQGWVHLKGSLKFWNGRTHEVQACWPSYRGGSFFSRIELNCYSFPILGPEENWRGQEWIQSASWSQGWDCAWQPPPVQAEVKSWQTGLAEIVNVKLSDNGDNNFVFRLFQLRRRSKWVQNTENTKLTPRSWQQSSLTSSHSIKSTGVLTLVCKSWFL